MTTAADRRLAKLERALAPGEAVLAWLVEAQQFPSLEDHARSIARLSVEEAPLSVIGERVEASVRASMKGQPFEAIREAVRRAIGDGAFLFSLVMQINGQTIEIAKVEGLRASAVFFWMGALLGGPRVDDLPSAEWKRHVEELADCWASWQTVVDRLSLDVRVEDEARATLQQKYFGGRDVLFADVGQTWTEHVSLVERLCGLAEAMASTGGPMARLHRSSANGPSVSMTERVAGRVTRLVDDARVHAYEIIGDRERAVRIVEHRLLAD